MVMISWFRIIVFLLTIAVMWRLLGWCFQSGGCKRTATVWNFFGRIGLVLGALMIVGMLLTGLALVSRHIAFEKELDLKVKQAATAVRVMVGPKTPSPPDAPASIDKLWDRINRPRIPVPSKQIALVVAEKKAAVDISEAVIEDSTEPVDPDALAETSAEKSRELPDWVIHPPKRVGNTYRRVVKSGPFKTVDECHDELEDKLRQAVFHRMAAEVADGPFHPDFTLSTFEAMGIGTDYIYAEICTDEYVENLEASFGPMVQVHLKLEFNPSIEQQLHNMWRQYQAGQRLGTVAFLASLGLLLLGLTYGLLKLDTWTRGYYSKRLLLGVPAVIIGLFMLLMVL
ncbi:MAG: hypothetical protein ABGX16_25445 [Pirellulales bacterium]